MILYVKIVLKFMIKYTVKNHNMEIIYHNMDYR